MNKLAGATVPIQFSEQVAAGATQTQEYVFEADGVLEGILRIRFYKGAELDLWLYPTIVTQSEMETDVIQYRGDKKYVDGEDDVLQWNIRKRIKRGHILRVKAVNNNATYAYDYRLDASVNYIGES